MEEQDLQASVGEMFSVYLGGAQVELQLINFRALPPRFVPGLRERSFALLFRGPSVHHHIEALPRQVHNLHAANGKVFSIYLEPIVCTGEPGMLYEAIFD
jgi:hypothetical protein